MQTKFSLLYVDCSKNSPNPLSVIHGPFIFESKAAAEQALFFYVANRISESCSDLLLEYAMEIGIDTRPYTENNDISAKDMIYAETEKLNFNSLMELYSSISNDEGHCFSHRIEAVTPISLMESLLIANAVEVDGSVIEKFTLNRESKSLKENVFEAAFMNESMDNVVYRFSLEEVLSANFIPKCSSWQIGQHKIKPIQFST